jgi:hypothetical protein
METVAGDLVLRLLPDPEVPPSAFSRLPYEERLCAVATS